MVQQYDLRGKTALVTGATSGIGTEVAAELAKRGAEVILGVRSVDAGKKIAGEIAARYPGAKVEVGPSLDLKSQSSVRAFAESINRRKGGLDILVNNAGLGYNKREFTEEGVGILAQVREEKERRLMLFWVVSLSFVPAAACAQRAAARGRCSLSFPSFFSPSNKTNAPPKQKPHHHQRQQRQQRQQQQQQQQQTNKQTINQ
jgi:NAD(P)-dependent dehydrogenase (short-subunit alcohol dehydrogenase family)